MTPYEEETQKYLRYVSRDHFEYGINISLKLRYVYVETPKVGCSTIKDTLQRMELDYPDLRRDDAELIHVRRYSPLISPAQTWGFDRLLKDPDYFVFCFVRNPYTRLLSAYLDKIVKGLPPKRNILLAMNEDPKNLSKEISFTEFVDAVCTQDLAQMQHHWKVQYYQTFQDQIQFDFIGRLENFEHDCNQVFGRLRDDYRDYYRPEVRHATNADELIERYYTAALRDKVYQKYRIDFDYFGYDR